MNITLGYIDPVAFSLGPIQVRWYGIIIACGILLGYFIAQAALKQVGLHKDTLIDIIFYRRDCWIEIFGIWWLGGLISGIIVCKIKIYIRFK